MKIAFLAVTTSMLLASCATVDRNTSFDSTNGDAFALVVADNIPEKGEKGVHSYTYAFSRVDLQSSTFLPEWFSVVFDAGVGTFVVDELAKPAEMDTTLRFGGRTVVPGDYAYAARNDFMGNAVVENCFSSGAPVFRIVPGKINILSLGDLQTSGPADPKIAFAESAKVMSSYPKLNAPLELSQKVGSIAFETARVLGREACRQRDVKNFTIISRTK